MDSKEVNYYFSVAGSVIRVSGREEELFEDPGILAPFQTQEHPPEHTILCKIVDSLPEPEGDPIFVSPERRVYQKDEAQISYIGSESSPYVRVERRGTGHTAQFLRSGIWERIGPKSLLMALEVESMIAQAGGILLHASCIEHKGEAILFTAPSGTGKSTQGELWRQYRGANVINGDRIMIKISETGARAVGIPFSGSSGICKNRTLPLRAVVYLSQEPENTITPLWGVKAFRKIWEGCSVHIWDREEVAKAMDAVGKLIAAVPVYHLACTPDEQAVAALEAVLKK